MNCKKWTLSTLGIIGVLLLLTVLFVYIVDPLFQYHKPAKNGYAISNETYNNPGIAKNFDYNAVILGSSMCQNFKPSEFDEKFNVTTVKLTYSGAYALNHKSIMDIVERADPNKEVDAIFWGVDIYSFMKPVDQTRSPLPKYLYDANAFNDINYVLNKDIILKSLQVLYNQSINLPTTSSDDYYSWYSTCKDFFVPAKVINTHIDNMSRIEKPQAPLPRDEYLEIVKENMEKNIIPIIENNPQAEFYLFYPPYSILYWDTLRTGGTLDAQLAILEYITEVFLQYNNVTLSTFQNDESIVLDISLFKDHTHYHPDINSFIVENLDNPDYQITKDNYIEKLADLRHLIDTTDMDEIIEKFQNDN